MKTQKYAALAVKGLKMRYDARVIQIHDSVHTAIKQHADLFVSSVPPIHCGSHDSISASITDP